MTDEIPYGYCYCGCGQKTSTAQFNRPTLGIAKGDPAKYIRGHNSQATRPTNHPWKQLSREAIGNAHPEDEK